MQVRSLSMLAFASALLTGSAATAEPIDAAVYEARFGALWQALHDPANGYFSAEGVPYHAKETLLVEAPDYGHETTSEAFSYWLWLEANHGRLTGDWTPLRDAWTTMERTIIPTHDDQPTNAFYTPARPATYAPELDLPSSYPARLDSGAPVGQDPLADELAQTYGTRDVYGMHWLLDVDDWYGYGRRGDGTSRPSYINTFQRGREESVFETVPQPCWDSFRFGGAHGYLDLFTSDSTYARQWKYTDAPDADARAVQVMYWAITWAREQGRDLSQLPVAEAKKLGDYLRYALFDKYYKTQGCQSPSCAPGTGRQSAHYLLSWYYAWGGATDPTAGWAWRIGSSHVHFGYQNPLAAWALSAVPELQPSSPTATADWTESLRRQLELYQWLQTSEGAIAGGATNSWDGRYDAFPAGASTFHGLAYDEAPVYRDPASNSWFGWQAWSMQRVAEYYLATGDQAAGEVLDRWVAWVERSVSLPSDGTYAIPATLAWQGQPPPWTGARPASSSLHVTVVDTTNDVGVTASLARTLAAYAAAKARHAGAVDAPARDLARALLDRMWTLHRDAAGVSVPEARGDYHRIFDEQVYVPAGWTGTMPNGDAIHPGVTFLDLRSRYRQDPDFARVSAAVQAGTAPVMRYHRFWAQVEIALANADFARLFAETTGPGAGTDAGAGATADAGAGGGSSGGGSPDAGATVDAGSTGGVTPPGSGSGDAGVSGPSGELGDAGPTSASGSDAAAGAPAPGSSDASSAGAAPDESGCGCATTGHASSALGALALLPLLVVRRRRRR